MQGRRQRRNCQGSERDRESVAKVCPCHGGVAGGAPGIRITHLLGVPTNFLMMAQQPGFAEADLSHIVSIGVGGAAAPLALLETYAAKGVALQQLWGMTETGPPRAWAPRRCGPGRSPPTTSC